MVKLTRDEVQTFLASAADSFPHDECLTCECYLGYVTRLQIDSDIDSREIFEDYRSEQNIIHSCLGCDPCPPGDLYAEYVRNNNPQTPLITL
jgi:hypothetical protein